MYLISHLAFNIKVYLLYYQFRLEYGAFRIRDACNLFGTIIPSSLFHFNLHRGNTLPLQVGPRSICGIGETRYILHAPEWFIPTIPQQKALLWRLILVMCGRLYFILQKILFLQLHLTLPETNHLHPPLAGAVSNTYPLNTYSKDVWYVNAGYVVCTCLDAGFTLLMSALKPWLCELNRWHS